MFDNYIRLPQAAKMCGVSMSTLRKYIKLGHFPSYRRADSAGFPGNPGFEVTMRDVTIFMQTKDEIKAKSKKRSKAKTDDEIKQLLVELHTNMVRQTEIIGLLIEKL
jgi:hypothetical protein